MNKIIKHYSQAQAWHDPLKWMPAAGRPIVVIFQTTTRSNTYEYGIADHIDRPVHSKIHGTDPGDYDVLFFFNPVCYWRQVIRWAYLDDLLPLDLKGRLSEPLSYEDEDEF